MEVLHEMNLNNAMKTKKKGWHDYMTPEALIKHRAYCLETIPCECGTCVMRSNLATHKKTRKHKSLLQTKQPLIHIDNKILSELNLQENASEQTKFNAVLQFVISLAKELRPKTELEKYSVAK